MYYCTGAHTIGQAKCFTFRERLYNESLIDTSFATSVKLDCPISVETTTLQHWMLQLHSLLTMVITRVLLTRKAFYTLTSNSLVAAPLILKSILTNSALSISTSILPKLCSKWPILVYLPVTMVKSELIVPKYL